MFKLKVTQYAEDVDETFKRCWR